MHPVERTLPNRPLGRLSAVLIAALLMFVAMHTAGRAQAIWVEVRGTAQDIALADDGTAWIVGSDGSGANNRILKRDPGARSWTAVRGRAARIAVRGQTPWVVNAGGRVWRLRGNRWRRIHAPRAVDIGASAKGVWIIAGRKRGNDYAIYQRAGSRWKRISGSASRIDVDADGNPWVIKANGEMFALVKNTWRGFGTKEPAADISIETFGAPWMVGKSGAIWHFGKTDKKWQSLGGKAVAIAQRGDRLWQVTAGQKLRHITLKDGTLPIHSPQLNVSQQDQLNPPASEQPTVIEPNIEIGEWETIELKDQPNLVLDNKLTIQNLDPSNPSSLRLSSDDILVEEVELKPGGSIDICATAPNSDLCKLVQGDKELPIGGCFALSATDPDKWRKVCVNRRTVNDPYPNLHGELYCPIINPGPPAIMQKSCKSIGSQAIRWGAADSGSDKCGKYNPPPPGFALAFHDPININSGHGTCWSCPLGFTRTWARIDAPRNAPLQPCGAELVWNLPQYPEPGIYTFLYPDGGNAPSPLLERAFGDLTLVDTFLSKRAGGSAAKKAELWRQMIGSPSDSPEFKALVFAALLDILNEGPRTGAEAALVRRAEDYVAKRRRFVIAEAQEIYQAWQGVSGYEQAQALRGAVAAGGGMPMTGVGTQIFSWILGDSGSVNAKIFGTMPVNALGYAWASAVPDEAGAKFIAALKDLVDLSTSGTPGGSDLPGSEASFDPALLGQIAGAFNVASALGDAGTLTAAEGAGPLLRTIGPLKHIGDLISTKAWWGGAAVISIASNAIQVVQAGLTIHAQNEAESAMREAIGLSNQSVNLYAAVGREKERYGDIDQNQLILFWALATSPYKGGPELGKGEVTQTCLAKWGSACKRAQARVRKAHEASKAVAAMAAKRAAAEAGATQQVTGTWTGAVAGSGTVPGITVPGMKSGPAAAAAAKAQAAAAAAGMAAATRGGPASVRVDLAKWKLIRGRARARDIAVAADGTAWVIGTDKAPGGYGIWRRAGKRKWQKLPGAAVRIALKGNVPWVVNSRGRVYRHIGNRWRRVRVPKAVDIGASRKGVWIVAGPKKGANYSIYQRTRRGWKKTSGAAVRIAVDADGNPWVVNAAGKVFARVKGRWQPFKSQPAADISIRTFGAPWIVSKAGALDVYDPASKAWIRRVETGATVAAAGKTPWYLDSNRKIFRAR